MFLGGLEPIHHRSSAMLKPFFVLTRALFVIVYILFISKSVHLLYRGVCSLSNSFVVSSLRFSIVVVFIVTKKILFNLIFYNMQSKIILAVPKK